MPNKNVHVLHRNTSFEVVRIYVLKTYFRGHVITYATMLSEILANNAEFLCGASVIRAASFTLADAAIVTLAVDIMHGFLA